MNIGSTTVKLNKIKSYNTNNNASDVFKKQFYTNTDYEDIDYTTYENIDYNKGISIQEQIDKQVNDKDVLVNTGATIVVGLTSVASGILKLGENLSDGCLWLEGTVVSGVLRLFGAKKLAKKVENWTMDEIAKDKVGQINEFFYENTKLGRTINDKSYMKYDSKEAKIIQNVTKEAVIIAGATAATVVTGGAAAPLFAAGFAIGAGQSAENKFQDTENRDFWKDSVEIGIDGTIKGLSTMAYGKAGAAAFNGVKAINSIGITGMKAAGKSTLKKFGKDVMVNTIKENGSIMLKNAAKESVKETLLEASPIIVGDVKSGIQTGDWNFNKMIGETLSIYGSNFVGNLGGEYLENAKLATKAGEFADSWSQRPTITEEIQINAEKNRTKYRKDFKNSSDYYSTLDYVEQKNYWKQNSEGNDVHIVLDSNDPGLTSCLTSEAKDNWNKAVLSAKDSNNKVRVNTGYTDSDTFVKFVLGKNNNSYGQYGMPDNYNFARIGNADITGIRGSSNGDLDIISEFKKNSGIPQGAQKNDRIIFSSHSVDYDTVSMHTGKELNSYSERLPGGRLPDGSYELCYETVKIDTNKAKDSFINVLNSSGKEIWSGSLEELKKMQSTNLQEFTRIIYG